MARGAGVAVLPWTGTVTDPANRSTLGSDPKSATEPAGHWPAGVTGWLRMTCMMIGDARSRTGGRLTAPGPARAG